MLLHVAPDLRHWNTVGRCVIHSGMTLLTQGQPEPQPVPGTFWRADARPEAPNADSDVEKGRSRRSEWRGRRGSNPRPPA